MTHPTDDKWKVENVSGAMWAINKIKEFRAERDFYVDACKTEIERLKKEIESANTKCDNSCNFFLFQLNEYMDREDVPSKTTKTQVSLKLPNGKIVRKLPQVEIVDAEGHTGASLKNNPDLINFVGDSFTITTKQVDWTNFKKRLVINGDTVMTDDGEIIDCLSVREKPASVDIRIEDDE